MAVPVEDLLERYRLGEADALNELFVRLEPRLKALAHRYLRGEHSAATLQTTALLHELFIRLRARSGSSIDYNGVSHFFACLASQMRNIVRHAVRARMRQKRGSGGVRIAIGDGDLVDDEFVRFENLYRALGKLRTEDERAFLVFACRNIAGMNVAETREALAIADATLFRDYEYAKSFLKRQIGRVPPKTPQQFAARPEPEI